MIVRGDAHPSVLVYDTNQGRPGGYSDAIRIARHYGLTRIVHYWDGRDDVPSRGALILTNDRGLFDSTPLRFKFEIKQIVDALNVMGHGPIAPPAPVIT